MNQKSDVLCAIKGKFSRNWTLKLRCGHTVRREMLSDRPAPKWVNCSYCASQEAS